MTNIAALEGQIINLIEMAARTDETNRVLLKRVAALESFIISEQDEFVNSMDHIAEDTLVRLIRRTASRSISVSGDFYVNVEGDI